MQKTKQVLISIFLTFLLLGSVFAQDGVLQKRYSVDAYKVYSDEVLKPNPEKLNLEGRPKQLGSKGEPGAENLIRWSIQNENDYIEISNDSPANGPYCVKFSIGGERIPLDNCWLDIRRPDMAIPSRAKPLDVSGTDRVTFWIRAEEGSAPLWFRVQSFPPNYDGTTYSGDKQLSNQAFIDGETIIIENANGELETIRDEHFNGEWQFVSLPWKFLELYDSVAVDALLPFSEVWEGSPADALGDEAKFNKKEVRTITWFTRPENASHTQKYWDYEDNLWGIPGSVERSTWEIDEVMFDSYNSPIIEEKANPAVSIYSDEVLKPNPEKLNLEGRPKQLGSKGEPGAENIIRWSIQNENDYIEISNDSPANGPYCVKFSIGGERIPLDNCWLDIRRPDMAIPSRTVPFDASATGRVTFWIRAAEGSAPLWFRAQSFPPNYDGTTYSGDKQLSNQAFIDGETVIIVNAHGELETIRDEHFNGEWQFVSLPWQFLELYDSVAVDALLPFSEVWEGSPADALGDQAKFDKSKIRTITWFTRPENASHTQKYWDYEDNLWGIPGSVERSTWEIDEVSFLPLNNPESYPAEIAIFTDDVLKPNPEKLNLEGRPKQLGSKGEPGAENIIRWSIQNENDYIEINKESSSHGPYSVKFSIGGERIPLDNCWLDIRRPDMAIPSRTVPFDASKTDRVTFWIKAEEGSAPLWFRAQSFPPNFDGTTYSGDKQLSNQAFIDGETVIIVNSDGELETIRDEHFNGQWQFVSLPWKFLELYDSVVVDALLPFSEVWEGSPADALGDEAVFNKKEIRTITWFTRPENASHTQKYWDYEDNLWGIPGSVERSTWEIDEVYFTSCYKDDYGHITDIDDKNKIEIPSQYQLSNAYPNPFNPSTNISFSIPVSNHVKVDVYNIMGQKVRTLVNEFKSSGTHKIKWNSKNDDGVNVATGIYFIRMEASHFVATKKVMLLK